MQLVCILNDFFQRVSCVCGGGWTLRQNVEWLRSLVKLVVMTAQRRDAVWSSTNAAGRATTASRAATIAVSKTVYLYHVVLCCNHNYCYTSAQYTCTRLVQIVSRDVDKYALLTVNSLPVNIGVKIRNVDR